MSLRRSEKAPPGVGGEGRRPVRAGGRAFGSDFGIRCETGPVLVVVLATADSAAHSSHDGEDGADHEQDDSQRRQDADVGNDSDDEQDNSEDNNWYLQAVVALRTDGVVRTIS